MSDWQSSLLTAAALPWVRNRAADIIPVIHNMLPGNNVTPQNMFREDLVTNPATGRTIPNAGERLLRWARAPDHPRRIFQEGLLPLQTTERPIRDNVAFDLNQYVRFGRERTTIFISTIRPENANSVVTRWTPPNWTDVAQMYLYEIFAYGGIDVNRAIPGNPYQEERELAFPGGIRRELIRLAYEYHHGNLVAVHWNEGYFNTNQNANGHRPSSSRLPLLDVAQTERRVSQWCSRFPAPEDPHHEHKREAEIDPMDQHNGTWVKDPLYNTNPPPRNHIAAVLYPLDSSYVWFFCANRYAKIQLSANSDKLEWSQTYAICDFWSSLQRVPFTCGVDALLPKPNDNNQMYVFSGEMTVKIKTAPNTRDDDSIVKGPMKIIDEWASLREAGFTTVDAVLPDPQNPKHAWFFRGNEYVGVWWEPGRANDYIFEPRKPIKQGWPALAGFETVDTFVPNQGDSDKPWVFSGDQYASISISSRSLLSGPYPISQYWGSLRQAGFYT